jgi:hypothetical protein
VKLIKRFILVVAKKLYVLLVFPVVDEIKINQGIILSRLNEIANTDLENSNFKVFSQWGEDGILQYLISNLDIRSKTFIEFGVENFLESNCRFLMMKDNWSGFVIDGSQEKIAELKSMYFYWKYDLNAQSFFINKSNINFILEKSGFHNNIGILSIDLDGVDYYILDAIKNIDASILVCEFNSLFGAVRKISIHYSDDFNRTEAHYSNLYWGASLPAVKSLAEKKGYALVGINEAVNNAFFVKKDLLNFKVKEKTIEELFEISKYRESRNSTGNLTFLDHASRLKLIKGLPVYNIDTDTIEPFS